MENSPNQIIEELTISELTSCLDSSLSLSSSTTTTTTTTAAIYKKTDTIINSPVKLTTKKVNDNSNNGSITGERAVQYFGYIVLSQGHIWRPTPCNDIGIDGHIEFVNKFSTKGSKALVCAVQLKATIVDKNASLNIESVNYWKRYPLPVIVVQVYFKSYPELPICLFLTKEQVSNYINSNTLNNSQNKLSSSTSTTSTTTATTVPGESKVFDKNKAKPFTCESVQEYCIDYMRNNYVNYNENRYQDYLKIIDNSQKKADLEWENLIESFFQLKPNQQQLNNNSNEKDIDLEKEDHLIDDLFGFPLILIKEDHRNYFKNQLVVKFGFENNKITLNSIFSKPNLICNKDTIITSNEINNLSKWFSYLYCIANNDPIKSIEIDLQEIIDDNNNINNNNNSLIYIMVLELLKIIIEPNYFYETVDENSKSKILEIQNIIKMRFN